MHQVPAALTDHLDQHDPGGVVGAYLYGSSVVGGVRPASDIDLLVVTERSLDARERSGLVALLFQISGRRATAAPGRPLEVTCVVRADVVPWRYPPVCDFQYGEWLRTELADGRVPERYADPDLAVLLTTVQQHAAVLRGPEPEQLLDPVPGTDLARALHDSLGPLLDNLYGDERNVLLTLARMVVTLESGDIVPKDEAARRVLRDLPDPDRALLSLAAGGYLGAVEDEWTQRQEETRAVAQRLADRITALRA